MTLLATPVASRLGGTTFGGLGAAAIAAGSRGRATTVLVGASTASSVLPLLSTFSFAAFPLLLPRLTSAAAAGGDGSSAKAAEGSTPEVRCYRCGKKDH